MLTSDYLYLAHSRGDQMKNKILIYTLLASSFMLAKPSNPNIINGEVNIVNKNNGMDIYNTDKSIIEWDDFNISKDEVINFIQENDESFILNRITGDDKSIIDGILKSNANVFLINTNGILFTKNAVVDTNSFVSSTADITNDNFKNEKYIFENPKNDVRNYGILVVKNGKLAIIGKNIENLGLIKSENNDVLLASGKTVVITDMKNKGVKYTITAPEGDVVNLSKIVSSNGKVELRGKNISLKDDSIVEGNNVFLGTNKRETPEATKLTISDNATVKSNDSIVAWGDNAIYKGKLIAKNFIETSGKNIDIDSININFTKKGGTWLIDPSNFDIVEGDAPKDNNQIGNNVIVKQLNNGTNVNIKINKGYYSYGDINIKADIVANPTNGASLIINDETGYGNVNIDDNITIGSNTDKMNVNIISKYGNINMQSLNLKNVHLRFDAIYSGKGIKFTKEDSVIQGENSKIIFNSKEAFKPKGNLNITGVPIVITSNNNIKVETSDDKKIVSDSTIYIGGESFTNKVDINANIESTDDITIKTLGSNDTGWGGYAKEGINLNKGNIVGKSINISTANKNYIYINDGNLSTTDGSINITGISVWFDKKDKTMNIGGENNKLNIQATKLWLYKNLIVNNGAINILTDTYGNDRLSQTISATNGIDFNIGRHESATQLSDTKITFETTGDNNINYRYRNSGTLGQGFIFKLDKGNVNMNFDNDIDINTWSIIMDKGNSFNINGDKDVTIKSTGTEKTRIDLKEVENVKIHANNNLHIEKKELNFYSAKNVEMSGDNKTTLYSPLLAGYADLKVGHTSNDVVSISNDKIKTDGDVQLGNIENTVSEITVSSLLDAKSINIYHGKLKLDNYLVIENGDLNINSKETKVDRNVELEKGNININSDKVNLNKGMLKTKDGIITINAKDIEIAKENEFLIQTSDEANIFADNIEVGDKLFVIKKLNITANENAVFNGKISSQSGGLVYTKNLAVAKDIENDKFIFIYKNIIKPEDVKIKELGSLSYTYNIDNYIYTLKDLKKIQLDKYNFYNKESKYKEFEKKQETKKCKKGICIIDNKIVGAK